ncbi:MAG: O-antigen ligase family protein [Clostridia bacterium]|nr:O-antigen ligase family protein [Clostridia bacterium]
MENAQILKTYKLPQWPIIRWINAFIYSKAFVVLIAILTVLSNAYAMDTYFFCAITAFAIYIAIFGKDFSPYLPMLCFCYIASSVANNPGVNPDSILFPQNSGYLLFYLAGGIIVSMILRFSLDKEVGFYNMVRQKRTLTVSILILGLAYFLSGILSKGYMGFALKNLAIAALQFAVIIIPYFILSFTVKWKEIKKDYLIFTGLLFGLAVSVELIYVYIINNVMASSIQHWKGFIYTGWGISNNMGAIVAMTIPFAFYYACKSKNCTSIIWLLIVDFMCLMTVFSCSRTSILVGVIFVAICTVITLIKAKPATKLLTVLNTLFLALLIWYFCAVYTHTLYVSFVSGLASTPRVQLYTLGFKTFLDYPVFGNGFYSLSMQGPLDFNYEWSQEISFTSFFPARWHNTIIQLLATGGIVALLAYGYHRVKTIILLFKKRSIETTFTFISIFVLLVASLLDCHFFNLGPVLFYSVALAFVEFRIPHFTETTPFKEYTFDLNENCLLK